MKSDAATRSPGSFAFGPFKLLPARQLLLRENKAVRIGGRALDLNDPSSLRFSYNNSINVMVVLSQIQWLTNSPGAAERTADRVVDYGIKARHELSLSIGLAFVCLVYFWAGRDAECHRCATMLDDLVERHGIVTWRPIATFCRGALASLREETRAEGIESLQRAVAQCRAIGHMARLPYYIGVLAEALTEQGRLEEAEATIGEALDLARMHNENWSVPELLRIRAFLFAAQRQPAEQEVTLLKAMGVAKQLGATSWQLRAGTDLARLWQAQARAPEAKAMLQPVLEAFTDGFDTRDLKAAAALLAELQ